MVEKSFQWRTHQHTQRRRNVCVSQQTCFFGLWRSLMVTKDWNTILLDFHLHFVSYQCILEIIPFPLIQFDAISMPTNILYFVFVEILSQFLLLVSYTLKLLNFTVLLQIFQFAWEHFVVFVEDVALSS